jgi:hypothetical protein
MEYFNICRKLYPTPIAVTLAHLEGTPLGPLIGESFRFLSKILSFLSRVSTSHIFMRRLARMLSPAIGRTRNVAGVVFIAYSRVVCRKFD